MQPAAHLAVALLVLTSAVRAQPQQAEFLHLTPRDGLSDAFVWPILQTQDGYMWFGTTAGLDRYDGYSVERFMHDPDDETSIRQGSVHSLIESPDGTIWAGTTTGLSRLDPHTRQFSPVELRDDVPADSQWVMQAFALHRSREGMIWAGTASGLYGFPETDPARVTAYRHDPSDPSTIGASRINAIVEDARGALWLGTLDDGLTRLEPASGVATHFRHDPSDTGSLPDNWLWDLLFDRNGQLWIGLARAGLCRFEPHTESFSCYRHDPADPTSLSHDGVQSIFEDDDGHLWVGTDGGGVSILERSTATFSAYRNDAGNPASLAEDDVHRIYRDRFGTMWFAHHNRGVSRMTPGRVRFTTHRALPTAAPTTPENMVAHVVEDGDGVVWMATTRGLVRHEPGSGVYEHFVPFPEVPPLRVPAGNRNLLSTLLIDGHNRIWTGNPTGDVLVFNIEERTFEEVATPEHDGWTEPAGMDQHGQIWIMAGDKGLWRLDAASKRITEFLPDPDVEGSLLGEIAVPFLDDGGTLWIAGYAGRDFSRPLFQRYDRERDAFEPIPADLPPNVQYEFIFMWPDRPGEFWLDASTGLYRFDAGSGAVTAFSRSAYGIPPGLRALERDVQGRLWYGTWTGSFGVFDPERGTLNGYYAQDGIALSRLTGGDRLRHTGEMVFTGFGGYVRFHPDDVLGGGTPPAVLVTGVAAGGEPVDFENLDERPIRLPHDMNTVAMSFVALHFADPARNQYRYMLEGFDSGWNSVGTQRSALYPRLPPGTYTFRVQAANSDGLWNEGDASIQVTILPPWWRTWWAYGFYGLMLVGGVFGADRVQRRRVVQQERERARQQELRHAREIEKAYESLKAAQAQLVQQEKLASLGALTAGIAHEIKNPLNFVNNFGQLSSEMIGELREGLADHPEALAAVEDLLADLRTNTAKIEEHGKRADSIVKSMLQHSRGGTGKRETVNLNDLVEEYVSLAYHGRRAQQPDFNVEIERDLAPDAGEVVLVPQDIGRVVLNLVGNAFDAVSDRAAAAESGGYVPTVRIATRRTGDRVEILIEDNGPGIPETVRERLFEPFFTTKAAGSGTGLGLSLSYEIVTQGHGGRLTLQSEPGEGSAFVVSLPPGTSPQAPEAVSTQSGPHA